MRYDEKLVKLDPYIEPCPTAVDVRQVCAARLETVLTHVGFPVNFISSRASPKKPESNCPMLQRNCTSIFLGSVMEKIPASAPGDSCGTKAETWKTLCFSKEAELRLNYTGTFACIDIPHTQDLGKK